MLSITADAAIEATLARRCPDAPVLMWSYSFGQGQSWGDFQPFSSDLSQGEHGARISIPASTLAGMDPGSYKIQIAVGLSVSL